MRQLPYTGINPNSRMPVFEQIKNLVQFAIISGEYKSGDQLPPVLALSKAVGVNLNTVAKAYRDLEVTGIITTRRGMGCFVTKDALAISGKLAVGSVFERLREAVLEAKSAGIDKRDLESFVNKCFSENGGPYNSTDARDGHSSRKRQTNQPRRA